MAKVEGTFYTAERLRRGTTPVSPPYDGSEGQQPPVTPSVRTTPPVALRYASEAAMIADQLNQRSGYLYFDGTNTWWYLGVANGVIGDYEAFGGSSYPEAIEVETNTVPFDWDYIIGNAAARTGNILFDFTSAKLGSVTMMVHNDSVEPTHPATGVVIGGEYVPSVDNYIYFHMTKKTASSESVKITYSQEI